MFIPAQKEAINDVRGKIAYVIFQAESQVLQADSYAECTCSQVGSTDLTNATILGHTYITTGHARCTIYSINTMNHKIGVYNGSSSAATIAPQIQIAYLLK